MDPVGEVAATLLLWPKPEMKQNLLLPQAPRAQDALGKVRAVQVLPSVDVAPAVVDVPVAAPAAIAHVVPL